MFRWLSGTIRVTSTLQIAKDMIVTLVGLGGAPTVLDGGGSVRLFQLAASSTLHLINIELRNGRAPLGGKGGAALLDSTGADGPARLSAQAVRIVGCSEFGSAAIYAGGASTHSFMTFASTRPTDRHSFLLLAGRFDLTLLNVTFAAGENNTNVTDIEMEPGRECADALERRCTATSFSSYLRPALTYAETRLKMSFGL